MQSKNFEYLRPKWEGLASLGAFAEQYAYPDPPSAVATLRTFAEQIVEFIYHHHGLPKPYQCNLNDLLTSASFVQAVPKVICSKLHSLRIHGNMGAHGESVLPQTAVWLVQEAYELGRWMHLNFGGGYFAALLRTSHAKGYLLRCAKKTTNLASINMTQLKGLPVPIPPIDMQRRFEKAAHAIIEMLAARKRAAAEADQLFGSLAQRAFWGEL